MDSLNGLTFGKKIYFEDVGSGGSSSSSSSKKPMGDPPAKKGKGVMQQQQQTQQPPRCQVEGCNVDLTGIKAYYCRHKVCGMHSKAPMVVVNGIEQRFCQQCSRFHQLNEFDQGKRSCRRRLAGHNERRRKPPPGPLLPGYAQVSSFSHEENSRFRSFLMDFTYPPRSLPIPPEMHPPITTNFGVPHHYLATHAPPSSESLATTDTSCALSLLSSHPWDANANSTNQNMYMSATTSQEMQRGTEFSRFDNVHSQFSGELELPLQRNGQCPDRSYDNSSGNMNWSL